MHVYTLQPWRGRERPGDEATLDHCTSLINNKVKWGQVTFPSIMREEKKGKKVNFSFLPHYAIGRDEATMSAC